MEIVNETVYYTEDLRAIIMAALVIAKEEERDRIARNRAGWFQRITLPETLRVGYFKPKPSKGKPMKESGFTSFAYGRPECPRLGIIHPDWFNDEVNPLVLIAQCADDDLGPVVPGLVVLSLLRKLSFLLLSVEACNHVTKSNRLRYGFKEDPAALKRGQELRRQHRIDNLEYLLSNLDAEVRSHRRAIESSHLKISKIDSDRIKLQEKLDKLCQKGKGSALVHE